MDGLHLMEKNLKASPVATIVNGIIKMKDGNIIGEPEGLPLKFD